MDDKQMRAEIDRLFAAAPALDVVQAIAGACQDCADDPSKPRDERKQCLIVSAECAAVARELSADQWRD